MDHVVTLLDQVRLLRNRLVEVSSEVSQHSGVSPPQRAVLEFLHREGPATVPGVARARAVSRQHIQTIVNDLVALCLVDLGSNPAHRRSPLISLRPEGAALIEKILTAERDYLDSHLADVDDRAIRAAIRTLDDLRRRL
jgi:DNA-binding MarR family transcriptional regulator